MKKLIIIIGLFSIVLLSGCQKSAPSIGTEELAKCLGEKGVKMYGTASCSHCLDQKEMFGETFKYINYVDCGVTPEQCQEITGTPTREFSNGDKLEGRQELEVLKEKSGC